MSGREVIKLKSYLILLAASNAHIPLHGRRSDVTVNYKVMPFRFTTDCLVYRCYQKLVIFT